MTLSTCHSMNVKDDYEKMLKMSNDTILEKRQEEDVNFHEYDEGQLADELVKDIQVIKEVKEIETHKRQEEIDKKITTFLYEKDLSENLVRKLINTYPTDEHIRLLKTLNFNDNDIENLRDFWRVKLEIGKNSDSVNSITSEDSTLHAHLSQNSLYLKKVLSEPLIEALREIIAKKPADPVEYLGHWLLHFKTCEEQRKKRKEDELELLINREKLEMKKTEDRRPFFIERKEEEELGENWNYLNYDEL